MKEKQKTFYLKKSKGDENIINTKPHFFHNLFSYHFIWNQLNNVFQTILKKHITYKKKQKIANKKKEHKKYFEQDFIN